MMILHISRNRFDFIRKLGWALPIKSDSGPRFLMEPDGTTYHVLDDEYGWCDSCLSPFDSIDANSPTELEIVKAAKSNGRDAASSLRNHRQQDVLMLRQLWDKHSTEGGFVAQNVE